MPSLDIASSCRSPSAIATLRLMLVATTLALVFFVGSAQAWKNECPSGFKACNLKKPGYETCIANDVNNCGDCGKKCNTVSYATTKCVGGYYKCECKAGWANCDSKWYNGCEVDTGKDAKNCASCGNCYKHMANADTKCENGKCGTPVCKSGWGNCDGKWDNGCEKDLGKDVNNCGKCGNKCSCTLKGGEPTCSSGNCGEQCKKGSKYDNKKKCCLPSY